MQQAYAHKLQRSRVDTSVQYESLQSITYDNRILTLRRISNPNLITPCNSSASSLSYLKSCTSLLHSLHGACKTLQVIVQAGLLPGSLFEPHTFHALPSQNSIHNLTSAATVKSLPSTIAIPVTTRLPAHCQVKNAIIKSFSGSNSSTKYSQRPIHSRNITSPALPGSHSPFQCINTLTASLNLKQGANPTEN